MKIGIFDSGLGGLIITKEIIRLLPQYDYIYLGDTKRVPYGNRSHQTVYEFTQKACNHLFHKGCKLIVLACNTASATALRKLQRQWLPKHYPQRRILGVIIPTLEDTTQEGMTKKVGILGTTATINSHIYKKELSKLNPKIKVIEQAAPLLVPLIEHNAVKYVRPILKEYLKPLLKLKVQEIVLGCTHYPMVKKQIRRLAGPEVKIVSQETVVPQKLKSYLNRHPEIETKLTKGRKREFEVTDLTQHLKANAARLFGKPIKFKFVKF